MQPSCSAGLPLHGFPHTVPVFGPGTVNGIPPPPTNPSTPPRPRASLSSSPAQASTPTSPSSQGSSASASPLPRATTVRAHTGAPRLRDALQAAQKASGPAKLAHVAELARSHADAERAREAKAAWDAARKRAETVMAEARPSPSPARPSPSGLTARLGLRLRSERVSLAQASQRALENAAAAAPMMPSVRTSRLGAVGEAAGAVAGAVAGAAAGAVAGVAVASPSVPPTRFEFGPGPLGLGLSDALGGGVLISEVHAGSAAERQGMRVGCLVFELAGTDVRRENKHQLVHRIGSLPRPLSLVTALEATSTMLLPERLAALEKVQEAAREEAAREEAAREAVAREAAARGDLAFLAFMTDPNAEAAEKGTAERRPERLPSAASTDLPQELRSTASPTPASEHTLATLSANDEATLSANDVATLSANDMATLSANDEAALSANDEATLSANGKVLVAKDDALQMARARAAADLEVVTKKEAVTKKEKAAALATTAAAELEAAKAEASAKAEALAAARAALEPGAMEATLTVPPVSELEAWRGRLETERPGHASAQHDVHGRLEAKRAAVQHLEDGAALAPLEAVHASAHHGALAPLEAVHAIDPHGASARLEAENRALRTSLANLERISSQRACWMAQRLEQIGEHDETRRLYAEAL